MALGGPKARQPPQVQAHIRKGGPRSRSREIYKHFRRVGTVRAFPLAFGQAVRIALRKKLHHRALGRRIEQLTVAVVDNRRPMASMMRAMLAAIGTGQIETYEDPGNAFAAMSRNTPDLVIAAGAMQPFGGVDLIRAMRHADRAPLCFVPAMVMSAYAKPNQVAEALRAGAHQVLMLPTSASTVYRRLDWLLNDDRPFELTGHQQGSGHYVVSGVEERLALAVPRPAIAPGAAHAVQRRAVNG